MRAWGRGGGGVESESVLDGLPSKANELNLPKVL